MVIAAHAKAWEPLRLSLWIVLNFLRSRLRDKHNASFHMFGKSCLYPNTKVIKKQNNSLFHLRFSETGFQNFGPLYFCCLCTGWQKAFRTFSNFSLHHSLNGILSILSCSFRLSVGSDDICAVTRSTVNLQLCSSEYSSPLYSSDLPLISVAVCSSSNPTVRQTLSIRIISRK